MFEILRAQMFIWHISIHRLAYLADIPYKSLRRKLSGQVEFTKSEVVAISRIFPDVSISTLYETQENSHPVAV